MKSLHVPHERNAYTFVAGSTAVVFHLLRRLEQEKECLYAPVFQQASEWVNGDYAIGLTCDTIGLLWVGRKVPLTPSRAITKWAREFFADSAEDHCKELKKLADGDVQLLEGTSKCLLVLSARALRELVTFRKRESEASRMMLNAMSEFPASQSLRMGVLLQVRICM